MDSVHDLSISDCILREEVPNFNYIQLEPVENTQPASNSNPFNSFTTARHRFRGLCYSSDVDSGPMCCVSTNSKTELGTAAFNGARWSKILVSGGSPLLLGI